MTMNASKTTRPGMTQAGAILESAKQAPLALFCKASAAAAVLVSSASVSTTALAAVKDLPGGPAVNQLNLPEPITRIAAEQIWLHWFMMIICVVIFVAVFGVMFYSIWKHRKSVGHKAANFHESTAVAIAWTVIPF